MAVYFWWTLLVTVYSHVRFHSMGPFHYVWREQRIRLFLPTGVPNPFTGSRPLGPTQKKRPYKWPFISGGRAGTRTLDPLIKSQLLYQLSYASRTILQIQTLSRLCTAQTDELRIQNHLSRYKPYLGCAPHRRMSYASRTVTGLIIDLKSTKCKFLFTFQHIAPSYILGVIQYP